MRKVSDLEAKLTNPTATASRFKEELQKKIQDNIKFNETLLDDTATFSNKEIVDGSIIVRAMKYTGEQENDGLLLERKYQSFETQGGKPGSKVEDWDWSPKAKIVKMPPSWYIDAIQSPELKAKYNNLKEGDEVWCSMAMFTTGNYMFIHQRDYPVQENSGYLSIPISGIQCKIVK